VELAKLGGVYGFCIHDFWFDGHKVLETPLNLILANPQIDMPFCLNWANENWSRRWDGLDKELLLEHKHSPEDDLAYAESLKAAFQDKRYIRINGRPLLMLYRPRLMPDAKATIARWREFFQTAGLGDPYMVMPQVDTDEDPSEFGMDAVAGFPPHKVGWRLPDLAHEIRRFDWKFAGAVRSYDAMVEFEKASRPSHYRLFPGVCPDWDNEARAPQRGFSFHGSTPARYGDWLADAAAFAGRHAEPDERIVFINAWNEWAEGTYLEPDRHHGFAYLAQTRKTLDELSSPSGQDPGRAAQAAPVALKRRLFGRTNLGDRLRKRLARLFEEADN
jgi:lipopolysaccharide biosynthesis protein